MKKVLIQMNGDGILQCPIWNKIEKSNNIQTILFDRSQDVLGINPDLIILQCATRWFNLYDLNYDKLQCPIIGSCGDASVLANLDAIFNNLPLLTRLHVEGHDYIEKYSEWCITNNIKPEKHKLIFQKLCADVFFEPLEKEDKIYDWCFIGQVYPSYDVRLKHYRNDIIRDLCQKLPNAFVAGNGWDTILENTFGQLHQNVVNSYYNKSHAIISIDAHDGSGYTSTRTIESMFAGHCTLIYDHDGMEYLKQYIQDGVHAYYFKTVDECIEIIEHIKLNKNEAELIGKNARNLIIKMGWTTGAWLQSSVDLLKDDR